MGRLINKSPLSNNTFNLEAVNFVNDYKGPRGNQNVESIILGDGTQELKIKDDIGFHEEGVTTSDYIGEESHLDTEIPISKVSYNGESIPLSSIPATIIRTAELANIDITLSKDGKTIETKNTNAGGKVDFNVSEVGTYTLSTNTWSKDVVVEELNTIIKAYAGTLANYTFAQIHEACQLGIAHLMWKPKEQLTYVESGSIYNNHKIMIRKITLSGGKNQIKWCLAYELFSRYNINPQFGYLTSSTAASWSKTSSNNGGMKYSALEQRFKVQGEEVYSQAQGLLPEDYSGTLETGVKPSGLYYTDQNGTLCKVYDYDKETDSFSETNIVIYTSSSTAQSDCKFIKGYFKSVGTIDEQTFNGGYYYVYDSTNYVYTRATTYTSGTTYYGLYEILQEDGVFISSLSSIRQYLVKEERKASAGGTQQTYLSSFSDYANLLAVEEITGLYRGFTLPSGKDALTANAYNLHGEGEKEEGFDFETQVIGGVYWTRSASSLAANNFCDVEDSGEISGGAVLNSYGVRAGFTTL